MAGLVGRLEARAAVIVALSICAVEQKMMLDGSGDHTLEFANIRNC